ncbi:MAG TPA: MFS transporter, partial [Polyangiaceae bacterium]
GHRARLAAERANPLSFDRLTLATFANTALTMVGLFAVVPNISTFLQHNIGYPRERLDVLYFAGGLASVLATRLIGTLVDRLGATRVLVAGTAVFVSSIYFGFVRPVSADHVIWVFPLLMLSASLRGVPMNTLATRVPKREERARFMSAQTAVQHFSSAAGALSVPLVLRDGPGGRLEGMATVSLAAMGLALLVPLLASFIERGIRAREREGAAP